VFVQKDWLRAQLESGKSLEQIGRELGKDHSTVGYWVKKHGLVANGHALYAPRGGVTRTRLQELVDSGLTIEGIAGELELSGSTVSYWLRRYGLTTARGRRTLTFSADGAVFGDCRRHGWSEFVLRKSDGGYRCARCRSEDVMRRRRRVKAILVDEAGGACRLCGYHKYVGALEFHHVDPSTKSFSLSHRGVTRSIAAARAEARKCVLLCANCHAEIEGGIVKFEPDEDGDGALPHSGIPG
jgi:5-methylcytosine-specific restriction endonuclease McrA